MPRVEHKQLLVRRRRLEKRIQVYQDLGSERGGAGGMVDKEASIVRKNEGVGR